MIEMVPGEKKKNKNNNLTEINLVGNRLRYKLLNEKKKKTIDIV